jgi:hypothetical protein
MLSLRAVGAAVQGLEYNNKNWIAAPLASLGFAMTGC